MRKVFIPLHIAVFLTGFTGIPGKLITFYEGALVWYRLFLTSVSMWNMASFWPRLCLAGWSGVSTFSHNP